MKVWIVSVRSLSDGRYIDSIWVSELAANSRCADLLAELTRSGCRTQEPGRIWWIWVSKAAVADARLVDEVEPEGQA
jgi:hypothetical protein